MNANPKGDARQLLQELQQEARESPPFSEPEYWLLIETGTLVGYVTDRYGKPEPMALTIYGAPTSRRLRRLSVYGFRAPDSQRLRFDGSRPPGYDDIMREAERVGVFVGPSETSPAQDNEQRVRDAATNALRRVDHEPADDFYTRVGQVYRLLADTYGTPVKDMASLAGVPHSTAARWVREARRRGHLEPAAKRGK